jgi:hypothetical protein
VVLVVNSGDYTVIDTEEVAGDWTWFEGGDVLTNESDEPGEIGRFLCNSLVPGSQKGLVIVVRIHFEVSSHRGCELCCHSVVTRRILCHT